MFLAVDRFPAGSVDRTRSLMALSVIFHSASDSRRFFRMFLVNQSEMMSNIFNIIMNSIGRFALLGAPRATFFSRCACGCCEWVGGEVDVDLWLVKGLAGCVFIVEFVFVGCVGAGVGDDDDGV